MAIGNAVSQGSFVYIYDEKGNKTGTVALGGGSLYGFTSATVSIKRGSFIYMYDSTGKQTGTVSA